MRRPMMFFVMMFFWTFSYAQNTYAASQDTETDIDYIVCQKLWDDPSMQNIRKITSDYSHEKSIQSDDIYKFFGSKQFINLEFLDLSAISIYDEHIKSLCEQLEVDNKSQSFSRLEFIDLSRTNITFKTLNMLLASNGVGKIREECDIHPNHNKPVSTLEVKIDDTKALVEFNNKLGITLFPLPLHFNFCIELMDSETNEKEEILDGIKQLEILASNKKYKKPHTPQLKRDCNVDSMSDSLSVLSIESKENYQPALNKNNFTNLLKNIENAIDGGRFTKKEVTEVVGYSGKNATRDFNMIKSLRCQIPMMTQWDRIISFLRKRGCDIEEFTQA